MQEAYNRWEAFTPVFLNRVTDMGKSSGDHMKNPLRLLWFVIALVIPTLAVVSIVLAFAEEPLKFRDPYAGEITDDEVSTIHDDLTYALALAAGFSITDSHTLQMWNQLVDSEQFVTDTTILYTNCNGAFYPTPNPDQICGLKPHSKVIWPLWSAMKVQTSCTTSRFGPYSPFFHFPHANDEELGALHDWAWGTADTLEGYEAYAWGGPGEFTVMQASCRYTRTAVITTGIEAGSLEAFGTYLHSLADYYSHRECLAAMDDLAMPWATHTLADVPACIYNPASPQPDDVHGREFYTYTDSLRTDEAIQHTYSELVARSLQGEGQYFPIGMDDAISGTQTLSDVLHVFVHQWQFDEPGNRRDLLDQLDVDILEQRQSMQRIHLPLALCKE